MAKPPKQAKVSDDADIISRLPDEILSHIISFLPLKEAIKTSMLSTRWRKIWTFLSNLNLDCNDFSSSKSFMNFVDRVLLYHTAGVIDKIRMSCGHDVDFYCVDQWIQHALRKKVVELDLFIVCENFYKLPNEVFTCNTLEILRLRLDYQWELRLPSNISLPSLKCLHLDTIDLLTSDDDSIQRLFSSFSVLEELVIDNCTLKRNGRLNVFNPTLKRLTLEYVYDKYSGIEIDAPSLVYFRCRHLRPKKIVVKNLSSLVEVCMDFATIYGSTAIGLFEGIGHVQSLHLFGKFSEDFLQANAPEFPKLTYLSLDGYSSVGWERMLPDLLSCFPCLKALEVNLSWRRINRPVITTPSKRFPSQLKTLKINLSFQGFYIELQMQMLIQMVEYLLKNAQLLDECTIQTGRKSYMTNELWSKITEKVLELSKIYKNCKFLYL